MSAVEENLITVGEMWYLMCGGNYQESRGDGGNLKLSKRVIDHLSR